MNRANFLGGFLIGMGISGLLAYSEFKSLSRELDISRALVSRSVEIAEENDKCLEALDLSLDILEEQKAIRKIDANVFDL